MHTLWKKALIILSFALMTSMLMSCNFFVSTTTTSTSTTTTTSTSTTTTTTETTTTTVSSTTDSTTTTTTTVTTPTTVTTTVTTTTSAPETTTTTTTTTTVTTTTSTTEVRTLEIVLPAKLAYEVSEILDLSGMVVTYTVNGAETVLTSEQYEISTVDLMTEGTKTVTITANGLTASFEITVGDVFEITMAYYLSASGLEGQALLLQLRQIINTGFAGKNYGDARYLLDDTDADPAVPGNVLLLYNGASVSGAWDGGITWNREHVWPQSLLGVSADNPLVNAASDLQNLKPANPSINSSRGNKYFDVSTTTASYAPRTQDRGDIARILLYMVVMYDEYTLVNTTPSTYQMAKLSVLLTWCVEDPVDDFERNRNDLIYTYQHNRNPFIDYPQFVDLIW